MSERSTSAHDGQRPLSTGAYVVLGLLLDTPASGWDLAQAAGRSISHFWPLTKAHIYTELPKLAERGFATSLEVRQDGLPDKRVYTVTDAGREAFARWLDSVELAEEHGRHPLQLQMFFATYATPERLQSLLQTWQEKAADTEKLCRDILERKGIDVNALPRLVIEGLPSPHKPLTDALSHLDARGATALFGLRRAQADQIWLNEVKDSLVAQHRLYVAAVTRF